MDMARCPYQGREKPRDGTGVDSGAPRDLVRPELAAIRERVEHRERTLDGGDMTNRWLSRTSHATLLTLYFDTPLPGRQFT